MPKTNSIASLLVGLFLLLNYSTSHATIHVRSRQLTAENGLKTNYVRSIVQDSRGYIWMGATNGLVRYDGYTAELLEPNNQKNQYMTDERVQSVQLWLNRFIWVRLRGQKYCCFDTETNQFVDYTGEDTMNERFQHSQIMDNGELWLTDDKNRCKVIRFDGKRFTAEHKTLQEAPHTSAGEGFSPSVYGIPIEDCEKTQDNLGNAVYISSEGEFWLIDVKSHQVTHLTNIYNKELRRLNGKPRYGVVTDKEGIIWISTYGNGLFAHNSKTGETTHFFKKRDNDAPIQTNYLLFLYLDHAGNIWACQENMGIAVISKQVIETQTVFFADHSDLEHSNSIHLLTRIDGQVYIGNRYNGLKVADGNLHSMQDVQHYGDDIVAICKDAQGHLWMGSRQSGVYVDGKNYKHEKSNPSSLTQGKISDIICDNKGRVWISIFDGGMDLAIPDGKGGYDFQHFFTSKSEVSHPRKMLLDHGGYLWLTSDVGLFVFHPDKLINSPKSYTWLHVNAESPTSDEIHCIFEDSRHAVIVGTSGKGVAVFDNREAGNPRFETIYNMESGIPHNNIQQIIEDDEGFVWVGTDQGIGRYDIKKGRTISLRPSNTIQGNMFVENAVCKLADGRLAFGSRQGIVVINPKTVDTYKPLFSLRITDIEINGVTTYNFRNGDLLGQQDGSKTIELHHNENSLVFHFSDFEFTNGITTRYTYCLKGFDKDFSPLSEDNKAVYKNLPPGDYVMEVKAQNSHGEWNDTVISQTIHITPPFWATWWAYLIYISIAGAAGWFIYCHFSRINALHNRIKVEKELTEYKLRFFTNISHEFRTPLTIIKGATDHISSLGNIPGDMKQPISSMQKSTDRMMRLVNQLLEFRKMQNNKLQLALEEGDIITFLRDIYQTFAQSAENKHLSYVFQPFAHHYTMFFDKNYVDKIVYNLLSNAVKYTMNHHAVMVKVTLDEEGKRLCIIVEDTGIGIPPENQASLFTRFNQSVYQKDSIGIGLHLTYELVKTHHGYITYQPNPEGGSIFTVTLPTDKAVYQERDFLVADNELLAEQNTQKETKTADYRELAPKPMNNVTVLIVEDDLDVQNFLQNELGKYFFTVIANNGQEALEQIRTEKPSLIVSDVRMPLMDGFEMTRRIRAEKEWADIPIILLTALSSEEKQVKGIESGADAYIAKPFSAKILIAKCRQLIEQRMELKGQYAKEVVESTALPEILTSEQDKRFQELLDVWLSNHYSDPNIDINLFADSMKYGRTNFYKKVKKVTGKTPNEYVRTYRMAKAAELMKEDTLTIAEISYKVGIDDPFYFSKTFKSYFGISPSQYRKGEKPKK